MSGPLLDVRDLSAGYGDLLAVRDINLHVHAGEVVVVLGPNGAGKTTLLEAVAGLVRTSSGEVRYCDEPINRLRTYKRSRGGLALVQQGKRVFKQLSIADNLLVSAIGATRDELSGRQELVFSLFPALAGRTGERAGSLSGGQQQMLAIGQALMGSPRVLLLDEPSAGLAPLLVTDVMNAAREIAGTGVAVLLVEQVAKQALRIADRVYVLRLGRIEEHNDPAELGRREVLERLYLRSQGDGAFSTGIAN